MGESGRAISAGDVSVHEDENEATDAYRFTVGLLAEEDLNTYRSFQTTNGCRYRLYYNLYYQHVLYCMWFDDRKLICSAHDFVTEQRIYKADGTGVISLGQSIPLNQARPGKLKM